MKQIAVYSALVFSLFSFEAQSKERTVQAEYDPATRIVSMVIEDAQDSNRACDYYVNYMLYSPASRTLSVRLAEELCLTEVIGKKKATLIWSLPRSLHMNNFCLRVDGKRTARVSLNADNVAVAANCD